MANSKVAPTWADFPYIFNPSKALTAKELTEVMRFFFAVKPVDQEFFDALPSNMQAHFSVRDNVADQPTILKGDK